MNKPNYHCPCGGTVQWKKDKVVVEGVDCGILDVEYCPKCGEEYFPDETMEIVEKKLKQNGLWGVKRQQATLWQSGKTVVLRIPKEITEKLELKADEKVTVYTEGKNKIIVEV
ncbi:AbrB/MazE/SpoVT family DNA-binding domain-containing protein [Candidatus Woesearchaeota archaeon]|nr:AbrB/MazE/SpoVT family DNA-binding domain-containing protein [Candidatus Woesearchaeota archaeon]